MSEYRIRPATVDDLNVMVRYRLAMFVDRGTAASDVAAVGEPFKAWLAEAMASGTYRAWLVETAAGEVVAGGGMTELPWPPGPHDPGGRIAFVYNLYTEPPHRGRGLARWIMDAIHETCRAAGIGRSVSTRACRAVPFMNRWAIRSQKIQRCSAVSGNLEAWTSSRR